LGSIHLGCVPSRGGSLLLLSGGESSRELLLQVSGLTGCGVAERSDCGFGLCLRRISGGLQGTHLAGSPCLGGSETGGGVLGSGCESSLSSRTLRSYCCCGGRLFGGDCRLSSAARCCQLHGGGSLQRRPLKTELLTRSLEIVKGSLPSPLRLRFYSLALLLKSSLKLLRCGSLELGTLSLQSCCHVGQSWSARAHSSLMFPL
jgi:hypothetical protein